MDAIKSRSHVIWQKHDHLILSPQTSLFGKHACQKLDYKLNMPKQGVGKIGHEKHKRQNYQGQIDQGPTHQRSIPPEVTYITMSFVNEIPPEPTAPPILNLHGRAEASDQIILSIAPDSICGFISERAGASRACPVDNRCYFFPPLSQEHGGVICCSKTTCQYHATCINSREYFQSTPIPARPTAILSHGEEIPLTIGAMISTSKPHRALLLPTRAKRRHRIFFTVDQDDISSIESQMSGARTAGTALGGPKSTSESTSGSTATVTETNANDGGSSKTPVAAIVGGTVSSVAVLAATGLGVFFFLRRKKKKQSKAASLPGYQQPPENKSPWSPGQQPVHAFSS
ncbi:hypothetical protein FPSE_08668 [Fusarium pseudograminearum CS3096]|uniref:Uncharacterized protein n=1 Tax=Fusarium pseudograminearum (strain CS3096) TaxID=1028729 RepID=K3VBF8_FUSPC|nr:hypothetical protein FPSE_08668 [Fusarium pseudograminearum CS3096]EKJ71162.1 hypothetical protein FPSE_08668 [Fusarium pseudograminearum CS3096]